MVDECVPRLVVVVWTGTCCGRTGSDLRKRGILATSWRRLGCCKAERLSYLLILVSIAELGDFLKLLEGDLTIYLSHLNEFFINSAIRFLVST